MKKIGDDLAFLAKASNDDLLVLCDIVTKERDGSFRITETLSETRAYRRYYPTDIRKMLPELLHEFRLFGGNSVLNFFRGEGPEYFEILCDVASKCKVSSYRNAGCTETVEELLLGKIVRDALGKLPDEKLRQLMQEVGAGVRRFSRRSGIMALERRCMDRSSPGFMLLTYVVSAALSQFSGRNIETMPSGMALLPLTTMMLGPLSLLVGVVSIAGPAYAVTVPGVLYIAYLRHKYQYHTYIH